MLGELHSTKDVSKRQRFSYWQDLICDILVNLDCSAPQPADFTGSIYNQYFANLQISTMVSDQMSLFRSPQRIARAREDYFLVAIEGRSRSFGAQDGREALLDKSDFALFDSTRPYDVGFKPGFQHFVIKIPRKALLNRVGPVHNLTGMRIRGDRGAGRLASQFFRTLQEELNHLDEATATRLGETGLDLLAAALADMSAEARLDGKATRAAWVARIKSFINSHLGDPTLSPAMIAAALGVSTRYLSMLFADEEMSIERFIWDRRLKKCLAALGDPAQKGCTISAIAFGWGFSDMSHFSRSFRERFGLSPREYRHEAARSASFEVNRAGFAVFLSRNPGRV